MGNKNTTLGIPNGMFAAIIFICGLANTLALVALLIYVALKEDDAFVKVSAKRAAIITFGYLAIDYAVSLLLSIPRVFTYDLGGYGDAISKVDSIIYIVFVVAMLFFAVTALLNQDVKKTVVDVATPNKKICPKCGNNVAANAAFCNKCGEKM
jgi:ribosomal protein L40E